MSFVVAGTLAGTMILNEIENNSRKDVATRAAATGSGAQLEASRVEAEAATEAIAEQRRQFDTIQKLMDPFVQSGQTALGHQEALLGLRGEDAQRAAIEGIEGSPQFEAQVRQGEEAILQNASATGGLRGGNVQRSLSEFRPNVLSDLINQRFQNLAGITDLGQSSAVQVGAAGQNTATNISELLAQQGQISGRGIRGAGSTIAEGQLAAGGSNVSGLSEVLGTAVGAGLGPFGNKQV